MSTRPKIALGSAHYAALRLGFDDHRSAARVVERLLAEHGEPSRGAPDWVEEEDRPEEAETYLTAFDWLCGAVVDDGHAARVARLAILPPPPVEKLPGWLLTELTFLPQVLCERHISLNGRMRQAGLMTEAAARADLRARLLLEGASSERPDWVPREPELDLGYCPVRIEEEEPVAYITLRAGDRLRTNRRRMKPIHAGFYAVHPSARTSQAYGRSHYAGLRRLADLEGAPMAISSSGLTKLNRELTTGLSGRRLEDLGASLAENARLVTDSPSGRPAERDSSGAQAWAVIGRPPVFSARAYRDGETVALSAILPHPPADEKHLRSLAALGEAAVLAAVDWPIAFVPRAREIRLTEPADGAAVAVDFVGAGVICDLAVVEGRPVIAGIRDGGRPDDARPGAPIWTPVAAAEAARVDGDPLRLLAELRDELGEDAPADTVENLLRAAIANGRLAVSGGGLSAGVLYCGSVAQLDLEPTATNPRRLYVARVRCGAREATSGEDQRGG